MGGVPAWVFLLFFILLYLGIKRCYKRTMKVKRLIILPAVFFIMALNGLMKTAQANPYVLLFWLCGVLIGVGLGVVHVRKQVIRADKKRLLVEIPGDWTMLLLIMSIFVVEFVIHYLTDISAAIVTNQIFNFVVMLISGLIVGMTIGRNGCYFYKYIKQQHSNLQES